MRFWKRKIRKVDCTNIKIYKDGRDGGYFQPKLIKRFSYIAMRQREHSMQIITIDDICNILSHEVLHKVLYETISYETSAAIDNLCSYTENLNNSGIDDWK